MTISPVLLQIAGIGVLIALGLAMLWWVVRTALGWHGGNPVYILPDPGDDRDDEAEDLDDADIEGDGK